MNYLTPRECIAKRRELLRHFGDAIKQFDTKLMSTDREIDVSNAIANLESSTAEWGFETNLDSSPKASKGRDPSQDNGNSFRISLQCQHSGCLPKFAVSVDFDQE